MQVIPALLTRLKGRFAAELGIDLKASPEERQKWFLAAILYGARISGQLAARTYGVFFSRGIYTPQAILDQGWNNLVQLLDEGGYTRYDYKTATKLLRVMESLQNLYQGSLERMHRVARDYDDLEAGIRALAPGIGPATANIFLRELRGIWDKAAPPLSALAQPAGEHLQLLAPGLNPQEALKGLTAHWQQQPVAGYDFADLEAALVRLGRDYCRKSRTDCPMGDFCGRIQSFPGKRQFP